MSIFKRLSFRMTVPILLLSIFLWFVLYLFVLETIGDFSRDRARADLKSIAREVMNTCNIAFDLLIQSGKLDDAVEVRIRKAVALGQLEDFFREFKLEAITYEGEGPDRKVVMNTIEIDPSQQALEAAEEPFRLRMVDGKGTRYFAYGVDFQPWLWRIVLLQKTDAYAGLEERIRRLYWTTVLLLLVMALGLILIENRLLQRPVEEIVRDVRSGAPPTYRGVEELEFLSRTIGGMMRTLTEREKRLSESENRYRTIFETTGTAIAVIEDDATLRMVNSRFADDTGYSSEELEGKKSWTELVSERDLEHMKEIHSLRTDPGEAPAQHEFTLVDKQGNAKNMLLTAGPIPGTTQSLISLLDITDRKKEELERRLEQEARAAEALRKKNRELAGEVEARKRTEDSLRASEERFRAVLENAEDGIFIKNPQLEYTHANPAYLRLMERELPEVLGMTDEELSLHPDYVAHAKNLERRVLQGESVETEHGLTWKEWPISLNVVRFPVRDSAGKTIAICGMARDVSDRRAAQGQLLAPAAQRYPSPAIRETLRLVMLAADGESTVLFLGESGTGKDYWARFLHDHSSRSMGAFFSINCAALAPELVESELFGHEAGAFTGARKRKRGLLELAEGGSLLLNEIGEMPAAIQSKLLTFLDEHCITRVGGETRIPVDARILAATNSDLQNAVEQGHFRLDLFYRLAVMKITVPPLRDRIEDVPSMVREILATMGEKLGMSPLPVLEPSAMEALLSYRWPGNVRELQNSLERALILCDRKRITAQDLGIAETVSGETACSGDGCLEIRLPLSQSFEDSLDETKRRLIAKALERSGGSIKLAAAQLKMTRNSIDHHMRRLGLRK